MVNKILWGTLKIRWGCSSIAPPFLLPMISLAIAAVYYCLYMYVQQNDRACDHDQ